jgi:carbon storage regulator
MIVVSRKTNESIVIGHNVRITIVDVRGESAWIAVEAPGEYTVQDGEASSVEAEGAGDAGANEAPIVG